MKTTPTFWNIMAVIMPPMLGLGTLLFFAIFYTHSDRTILNESLKRIHVILIFSLFSMLGILIYQNAQAIFSRFERLQQKQIKLFSTILTILSVGAGSLFFSFFLFPVLSGVPLFFKDILFGSLLVDFVLSSFVAWSIVTIWRFCARRKIIVIDENFKNK